MSKGAFRQSDIIKMVRNPSYLSPYRYDKAVRARKIISDSRSNKRKKDSIYIKMLRLLVSSMNKK